MSIETGERTETSQRRVPQDTFANRLILARAFAGHLSINEAADRCKDAGIRIGRGAWTNWEKGAKPFDMLAVVEVISERLDVDADWLLNGGPLATQGRRKIRWRRDEATVPESPFGIRAGQTSRPPGHPVGSVRPSGARRPQRRTLQTSPG